MAAPTNPFVLFRDDFSGDEVLFEQPDAIISADRVEDFLPALDAAQAAHNAGKWLAGYFSYEAGYLFEPKLKPMHPGKAAHAAGRPRRLRRTVGDGIAAIPPAGDQRPDLRRRARPGRSRTTKSASTALHRHLRQGDCYQANLTFPVEAHWTGDPLVGLRRADRAPAVKYGALVALGEPVVLSRSPELFFEIGRRRHGSRHIR